MRFLGELLFILVLFASTKKDNTGTKSQKVSFWRRLCVSRRALSFCTMNKDPPSSNTQICSGQFLGMNDNRPAKGQPVGVIGMTRAECCGKVQNESHWEEGTSNALISGALSQLPLHEREEVLNEIHGVNQPQEEARQTVERWTLELLELLRRYTRQPPEQRAEAFVLVAMQSPTFAFNRVACERFLRSSGYNVVTAASAMLKYFTWKRHLWGEKNLGKEIELDDMNETEIELLKTGLFQVLPERDRAGRQINVAVFNNHSLQSVKSLGRVLWYIYQLRLDQPSESMIVWITFHLTNPSTIILDRMLLRMYHEVLSIFPSKNAAYHHCIENDNTQQFQAFLTQILSSMDSENKAKTKVHTGPFTKWIDSLMSYGIPSHIAPVNEDGRVRLRNHLEFLQGRKTGEQLLRAGETNVIFLPRNSDILFGRGRPIQQTAGNLRLTAIVKSYVLEYHHLQLKQEKTALASKIVNMVKSASGRFLSRQSGIWTVVSDELAREKVSALFRTLYRKYLERTNTEDLAEEELF